MKNIKNDGQLPQNVLLVGHKSEHDKEVYISQPVYKTIQEFVKDKTVNESGGLLLGTTIKTSDKTNIIIRGFVIAKDCEATPTTLKFTHKTWGQLYKDIEKKYSGMQIVGWVHTHPNYGIFLSEYDTFIHNNYFKEDFQVAYVIDPIQNINGFYCWHNANIEHCDGYYIFDDIGKKIIYTAPKENAKQVHNKSNTTLIVFLLIVIIMLGFVLINMNKRINQLESKINEIIYNYENYNYSDVSIFSYNNKSDFDNQTNEEKLTEEQNLF